MALLTGWKKRILVTASQTVVDTANQLNFAALVYLSTSSGRGPTDVSVVFDELQSNDNRKKIAITTSDGQTQCYVEIVKWDHASEKAWLYVKIPTLAYNADTLLYLYYDRNKPDNDTYVGDTNSTPAENVWDEWFEGVYHMADGADNQHIYDSTSNNNDGTKGAAGAPVEAVGMNGEAQNYDGDNDEINVAHHSTLNFGSGDFEVLSLMKSSGITDAYAGLVDKYVGGKGWLLSLRKAPDTPNIYFYTDDGGISYRDARYSLGTICDGDWHLVGGRKESNEVYIVLDGIDATGARAGISDVYDLDTAENVGIGVRQDIYFFKDLIDETFISSKARSWPWHKVMKESLWDNLLTFGSEEILVTGPFPTHFRV